METFRPGLLEGKRALVTGGSSGIGLAIAQAMHGLGAEVLLLARDPGRLAEACKTMPGSKPLQADVRDRSALGKAAQEVGSGGLDILVCAAAGNFPVPFDAMSPNAWDSVVDIVLHGTANSLRAMRDRLRPGASVINIVAGYAWTGAPGVSHSGAAKAAVLNLTRSLAVEWAPGVRVNAISPGPIGDTEGMRRLGTQTGLDISLARQVPMGRFGAASEVAQATVFLASPAASYITGACLVVDGGQDALGPFGSLWQALAGQE